MSKNLIPSQTAFVQTPDFPPTLESDHCLSHPTPGCHPQAMVILASTPLSFPTTSHRCMWLVFPCDPRHSEHPPPQSAGGQVVGSREFPLHHGLGNQKRVLGPVRRGPHAVSDSSRATCLHPTTYLVQGCLQSPSYTPRTLRDESSTHCP